MNSRGRRKKIAAGPRKKASGRPKTTLPAVKKGGASPAEPTPSPEKPDSSQTEKEPVSRNPAAPPAATPDIAARAQRQQDTPAAPTPPPSPDSNEARKDAPPNIPGTRFSPPPTADENARPATPPGTSRQESALIVNTLAKGFGKGGNRVEALRGVSFTLGPGITALTGPDGAGKTTALRCCAGLLPADAGEVRVLGLNAAEHPERIQAQVGYMPQTFGLYEDLSVAENLRLRAELYGLAPDAAQTRTARLLERSGLAPFPDRRAGDLSGGMKQKLALIAVLLAEPGLLLLDEPSVGLDPLSRREIFALIREAAAAGTVVLMSTALNDEAARCDHILVLHEGALRAEGSPEDFRLRAEGRCWRLTPPAGVLPRLLQAELLTDEHTVDAVPRGGAVRLITVGTEPPRVAASVEPVPARPEDGLMTLSAHTARALSLPSRSTGPVSGGPAEVIRAEGLRRDFGSFTAVADTSFAVNRGEIFGLLGPNGAGKTTTFRMLCGLLPPTAGTLRVIGADMLRAGPEVRRRIGYAAQKFSLYGPLTVRENLEFFAGAYGLSGRRREERIRAVLEEFDLIPQAERAADTLPVGLKQRLGMAQALLHEPELLFLDEPTSGADPASRRLFWQRITALAEAGTTVVVTTHFMEEAEYCDRILLQDKGRVIAYGTPAEVPAAFNAPDMEEAFIRAVQGRRA